MTGTVWSPVRPAALSMQLVSMASDMVIGGRMVRQYHLSGKVLRVNCGSYDYLMPPCHRKSVDVGCHQLQGRLWGAAKVAKLVQGGQVGLRWGRPRLAMPYKVDAANARQQRRIANAMVKAGLEAVILYADESRLQLLPLVWSMWRWVGQQLPVPTRATNITRALFEASHIRTGQWIYLLRGRMRTDDFLASF